MTAIFSFHDKYGSYLQEHPKSCILYRIVEDVSYQATPVMKVGLHHQNVKLLHRNGDSGIHKKDYTFKYWHY